IKAAAPGLTVRLVAGGDEALGPAMAAPGVEVVAGDPPAASLAAAHDLKWLQSWSAGVDHALSPELVAHPAVLTCAKGNGAVPLAEHAILLMLMLDRDAVRWVDDQKARRWEWRTHGELNGHTVGIIGLGYSGADLAEKAKAFHMTVLGLSRSGRPVPHVDEVFTPDGLHEVMRRSDFVVMTAPLTDETRGMLDEAAFRAMKKTAFYVCFSRGGIADDAALLKALQEGWIAGAGLDAHSVEPLPKDSPFWDAPNTIITPHNGASSLGTRQRGADIFIANLKRYAAGQPLFNVVDKQAGY
ncbi:MAG: D-2-hydroxyacid dehydrogenase, partial [Alphaproteobacteria bacterium]